VCWAVARTVDPAGLDATGVRALIVPAVLCRNTRNLIGVAPARMPSKLMEHLRMSSLLVEGATT
jgi:hypothetical protein